MLYFVAVVVVVVVTTVVTCSCFYRASIVGKEVLPPPELERIFGLTGGRDFCIEQHFPSPDTHLGVSTVLLLSMSFPPMFASDLSSSMPVTSSASIFNMTTSITMCSPFHITSTTPSKKYKTVDCENIATGNIFHGSMSLDQLYMARPTPTLAR